MEQIKGMQGGGSLLRAQLAETRQPDLLRVNRTSARCRLPRHESEGP